MGGAFIAATVHVLVRSSLSSARVCVCVCVCVCVWGASMLHLIRGKMGGLLWGLRWAEGVILGEGVLNLVHQIQGELPEKLCGLTMLLAKARRRERA